VDERKGKRGKDDEEVTFFNQSSGQKILPPAVQPTGSRNFV
jgi:hypothetical protein